MAESQQHSSTKVGQLNVKFYQGSSGAFRSTTDYLDSLLAKYGNKGAGSAAGAGGGGYYPPAIGAHSSPSGDYIHQQQQQQQQHTQQHQFQQEGLPQQYPYQQAPASPYSRPPSYNPGGPYGPPSPYGGYPSPHHQPQYEHHGYPPPQQQPQYEHHGYPPPQQQPQHGQYGYPSPQRQPQHGQYGYPPHHHQSQYGQYGYPPPQQQPQHGQYGYPPPQQPPYQQYDPPRTVGIADRMRELEELRQKIMQGPGLKTDSSSPEVGLNSSYGSSLTRSQVTAPVSGEVSPERTPPPEAAVPKHRPRRTRNGSSLPPSQVASIMASPLGTRPPSRRQSETGCGQPGTPLPPPPPGGPGAGKRRPSRRGGSSRATSRGLSPESSRPVSPLPIPPDTTPRAPWSDAEPQEAPVGLEVEEERATVVQVAMSTIREEASRLSEGVASAQLSRLPTTFTEVTAAARSQVGTDAATTNATDAAEVGVTPSSPPPPKPTEGQEDEKGATEGGARKTDTDGEEDVEPTDPPVEEPPSDFDALHAAAPALCRPLSAQQSQRSAFGASAGDEQAAGPKVTGDDVELGETDDDEEGAHGEGEDGGGEKSDEGFGMALVMEDDGEEVGVDDEEEGDLDGIEARLTALLSKGAESSKSSLRKKSGRTGSGRQKSAGVATGDGEGGGGVQEAVQQSGVEANESARPELRVEVTSPASRWPGSSEHVTSVPMMEQRREQARPAGDQQKQAPVRSDTQSTVERSRPSSAVDRNPSRASSSRSAAAPVAAVVAQASAASLREQAEKERAMELYRRAIRGKSTPTSTTSSPRRAAQETPPMPQRSTSHPKVAGSTGQRASSSGRHRPPQPSDVPRKEYTKQSAVPDGHSAGRRKVKSATGSPYTRVKSATRPPRRPASSTPHYAEEPHDRPIRSARSNARPPSAAVRELFKDDPVPLFAVSLSRAPRAKGPRRVVSANDALRKAALHAEAQATRVAQRFHSASPAGSRQRQSSPARSPRSSTVRRSLVRSAWSENSEVDSGIPFHEAAARMQNEVDTKISALGCIMEERGKANKDLQFGSAMSKLLGAGTLQTALHPPDSPPSRRRVQSAAPTSGGKHSSGNVRPPSARPSPSAAARPQSAHPTTGAAAAREARPSHGAGHGRLGNATAPLRAAGNNDGKEAKQCRGAHPVGDASRAEKSIRRVDTIATKWKLDESGEKYDVINNWQVDYDPKTLAALQRTHSKEVVKTAADSEASARMNLSSRSLAPSMRHTWWGGVNEDDAERLWSLSRQQSGAQEGARLTAAD